MTRVTDMITDKTEVDTKEPVIGIGLTYNLGNGRTMTFQTMAPRDADLKTINPLLDKLTEALERQVCRMCIEPMEDDIRKSKKMAESAKEDLLRLDASFAGRTLNEQAKQQRAQAVRAVEGFAENVTFLEGKLAATIEQAK